MNFIARETRKLAIKSNRITDLSPRHDTHNFDENANYESRVGISRNETKNLGRQFAYEGLDNSLGVNAGEFSHQMMMHHSVSSVNSELDRLRGREGSNSMASNFTDMFSGSQLFKSEDNKEEGKDRGMSIFLDYRSMVSQNHNPAKTEENKKEEIPTVDNLTGVVKRIYFKIREQLDDPSHPLNRIIRDF